MLLQKKPEQKPQDAEGFLCPMCMSSLPGPAELQRHFETVHSEGGPPSPAKSNDEKSAEPTAQLINLLDDETDLGTETKLQFSPGGGPSTDADAEVQYLQQEMAELTTAIKEEKWYSGQLKEEFDRVTKERDKLEEEREMFMQEYDSKLRSAEDSFLQVAEENEKLKEELKYADFKSQKERHNKLNAEIQSVQLDLSNEKEMKSALEEANKHMMNQIEDKDKLIDNLKFKLNERPTNDTMKNLENEVKDLKEKLDKTQTETGITAANENKKWQSQVEDLNTEISRLQLANKELDIEKTSKIDQLQSIQTALSAALETSKQAQQQSQEKQQQIIDLQHEAREAQASLKEKASFMTHLQKQLEDSKSLCSEEVKSKQELKQQLRNLQNSLDAELRNVNQKDSRIYELENSLKKEKSEVQRLESEGSELVAKIEAGAGVETAINQLRQEKEKLCDGVATMEKELEAQSARHTTEVNSLRDKNTKLVEELEKQKIDNEHVNKKMKDVIEQLVLKEKSNEELRIEIRSKSEELRKIESERSAEKASFEKRMQELSTENSNQAEQITTLQQKNSNVISELSSSSSSITELQASLKTEKDANENLGEEVAKLRHNIQESMQMVSSTKDELASVKEEGRIESNNLGQELSQKVKSIEELNSKIEKLEREITTKENEIESLNVHLEKDKEERQLMQKEFDTLTNNEVSLKSKIQELEEEFRLQKEHLNEQISAVRKNKEEQGSRFNTEIEKKNEELGAQKKSFENDVNELKKTIAQNMAKHAQDLQQKNEELSFISESSKEAISGYQESMEELEAKHAQDMQQKNEELASIKASSDEVIAGLQKSIRRLEESLNKETTNKDSLAKSLKKIDEEKAAVLVSLEQKDSTLMEIQRQLEVAQKELKKPCEGCHNYETQLCRFQEMHKEQISIVQNYENQVEDLNNQIKSAKDEKISMEENIRNISATAEATEADLRKTVEQMTEVKAVLEARVLELDDELKEAYNKYDNLKSEMTIVTQSVFQYEENIKKITESKAALEEEIKSLKIAAENSRGERLKEKEEEKSKVEVILNQQSEVENQLKVIEKQLELEKANHQESIERQQKIQSVLQETSYAIQNKLDNTLRDKEDLRKSKEQSEARLSAEMTSLKENLMRGRKEIDSYNKKIKELEQAATRVEKEKDDLRGEIAVMEVQVQHTNDEKRALADRVLSSEEAHKRTKERLSETNRRLEQGLAALQELGQENQAIQIQQNVKLSRQWEDDSKVTNCKNCDKVFSLTIRKHHCRHCGGIFCNDCSNNYTQVAASKKPVRVCEHCFGDLRTIRGRRMSAASLS